MTKFNNSVFYDTDYDESFAFVYVNYNNYLYTIRFDKITGNTVLVGTNKPGDFLDQDDMNNIADLCYDYFKSKE